MKNCINFKFLLISSLTVVLLMSNVIHSDAQVIRVAKSDPDIDRDPYSLECVDPNSNELTFHVITELPIIYDINIISVESAGSQDFPVKIHQIFIGMYNGEYVWEVKYSFNHNLGNYSNSSGQFEMEVEVDFGIEAPGTNFVIGGSETFHVLFDYCVGTIGWFLPRKSIDADTEDLVNKIYPNPAKDELTIEIQSEKRQQISIQLLNQLGEVIKVVSLEHEGMGSIISQVLDISEMSSGIYYLSVSTQDKVYTEKIVKL